jgi:hypothetical protein
MTTTETVPAAAAVPTVYEAWARVMQQALALGKGQQYDGGEGGGRFRFRGIDDVMNLVGPILRLEGVSVIPSVRTANYRDVMTRGNKPSREVTVLVDYTITGPAGDTMFGSAPGESMDTGDKGTAKAMSVAFRVFLLQALCLPTDEPDPDSEVFQRAAGPTPEQQAQKVADGLPESVSFAQVDGVKRWAAERGLLDVPVTDPDGNRLAPLLVLLNAKLDEHAANEPAMQQARQANVDKALGGGGEPTADHTEAN